MRGENAARRRPDDDEVPARAALVAARPAPSPAPPEAAHHPVAEEGGDADHDHDDRLEADVEVLDVRHLVGDDALELGPVHLRQQAGRDADDRVLGIAARGEGVRRRVVDHVAAGHRDAGGDGQALDGVDEIGELLFRRGPGAADGQDDLVARIVADEGQAGRDDDRGDDPGPPHARQLAEERRPGRRGTGRTGRRSARTCACWPRSARTCYAP